MNCLCLFFLLQGLSLVSNEPLVTDTLPNRTIAVMVGSIGEAYVQSAYPSSIPLRFDDIMDAFTALVRHKADYVLTSFAMSNAAARSNPGIKVLPQVVMDEGAFIATSKDDPQLTHQVDSLLNEWLKNGTMSTIISHWIREDESPYEVSIFANRPTNNPPLRVATSADREPMSFIKNNAWCGMDWEVAMRIGEALQRQVVVMDMKFASMVVAIQSGKADMIASNLAYTAERAQKVNYSPMYFANPQVFCVPSDVKVNKDHFWNSLKSSYKNNVVKEKRYLLIWNGLKTTLVIAFFAGVFGSLLAVGICALRMSRRRVLRSLAVVYVTLFRGIPQVVILMIMYYVVLVHTSLSPVAVAIVTFSMVFGSYAAEIYRTAVTSIPKGQREAGLSLGFTKLQTFMSIILPQAAKVAKPVFKGELVSLIKITSIVGYIAVQDLTKASDIIRSRTFDAFFPLLLSALIYLLIIWLVTLLVDGLFGHQRIHRVSARNA